MSDSSTVRECSDVTLYPNTMLSFLSLSGSSRWCCWMMIFKYAVDSGFSHCFSITLLSRVDMGNPAIVTWGQRVDRPESQSLLESWSAFFTPKSWKTLVSESKVCGGAGFRTRLSWTKHILSFMMKRLSKCLFVASQTSASDVTLETSFDVRSFKVRLQLK